ncbi:hypothetical protein [Poriferisphaera sp. WC338]|uniref:hypothetical protein n=1 Tax=Poriferisphaera sp. WC338 TaxID=3425129 RepID=UPI003D81C152
MWQMVLDLIKWQLITDTGVDAMVYFAIGGFATTLFVLRLLLMLFVGDDGGDIDLTSADIADATDGMETGAAFNLFSLLSLLAFAMGFGWMGLAGRITWELNPTISLFIALAFGSIMMFGSAFAMMYIRRFEGTNVYDVKTGIGRTGRVYLTVPANASGQGQVEVTVSGRRKIFTAMTKGAELSAFSNVRITEVGDDEVMWIESTETQPSTTTTEAQDAPPA